MKDKLPWEDCKECTYLVKYISTSKWPENCPKCKQKIDIKLWEKLYWGEDK